MSDTIISQFFCFSTYRCNNVVTLVSTLGSTGAKERNDWFNAQLMVQHCNQHHHCHHDLCWDAVHLTQAQQQQQHDPHQLIHDVLIFHSAIHNFSGLTLDAIHHVETKNSFRLVSRKPEDAVR